MRFVCIVIALLYALQLSAQQQSAPPPNAPVELPEVLVTGKELIDVGAGSKQAPSRPSILSSTRLDSLNPTEKLPIPRLPARSLPTLYRPFAVYPGYLDASMGTLITPSVAAGYSFETAGYRIDLDADVEASDGWVENAGYLRSALKLRSTYIAPDQFLFFGGSTTHVNADANYGSYRLFARADAAERHRIRAAADVDVTGVFEDYSYSARVGYGTLSMTTTGLDAAHDNALEGSMTLEQRGSGLLLGADAAVSLRNVRATDYPYAHVRARGVWTEGNTRIRAVVGPQLSVSSRADERFGISAEFLADVLVSKDVTASARLGSGLRSIRFSDLVGQNPFIDPSTVVDVPYDVVSVSGTVRYHPSVRLSLAGSLQFRMTEREPVWYASASGMFAVDYLAVRRLDAHIDGRFALTSADELRLDVLFTQAAVIDSSAQPYVPSAVASLTYQRAWTSGLTSDVGIVYFGQRWADMASRVALSGYVDLRARVTYALSRSLDASVRVENILASTIVLWEGYRERGFFATAGLTWRF